jgi:nitric oxide reductase NorD protein
VAAESTLLRRARLTVARAADALRDVFAPWRRRLDPSRSRTVKLDDVRRRLELLVTAVYDRPIPIATAEPQRATFGTFWTDPFMPRHLQQKQALATTDGERIQLPASIEAPDADAALAKYRLMAIEQAERIVRGTVGVMAQAATRLERDLYLVREGQVVDEAIARTVPGLRGVLAAARAEALDSRFRMTGLTGIEQLIEEVLREGLAKDLTRLPPATETRTALPDESLLWARERALDFAGEAARYRGIAPVAPWGTVKTTSKLPHERLEKADELAALKGGKYGIGKFGRGSGEGGRQQSETGHREGTAKQGGKGDLIAHPEGPKRIESPAGSDLSPGGVDAPASAQDFQKPEPETASDRDEAPDRVASGPRENGPRRVRSRVPAPKSASGGTEYPEWDWEAGDYRDLGAIVRTHEPDVSDDTWGNTVLARHGALVRRLREKFDRLRARRARLAQQRDGDELDLTACVRALVDQRTGHGVDDRMYIAVRPARRGLAIALLIDISGSTDEWIDARRRVIDVEKVALLLASEALDALGDRYAILTFSGKGRSNVRMRTVKAFDDSNGADVRRRIAALQPEGYTRAGAAIRHAAALLERQPAAHRLLLIISDGKPNDVDAYEGLAGVEDTRQAIIETRRAGVYPFCLTIDRQGQDYLGRIFGEAGHTVLRNPQQLPMALVKVVKHLLVS